jgi:hypothetical protein
MLVRSVLGFVAVALMTVGAMGATKRPVHGGQAVFAGHVSARSYQSFDYAVAPPAESWPGGNLLKDPDFIAPNGVR